MNPHAGTEVLTLEHGVVAFGAVKAVDDVSLEVRRGEVVGLIGPNGSGKTTTLNLISGLVRPASGRVRLGDRDITRATIRKHAHAGVVRTFQSVRPFERLTVRQNVEVAALAGGMSPGKARGVVDEILAELQLEPIADVKANAVTAGQVRRIGIARALASQPRFLLLDEPAAGQNEAEGTELIESIKQIVERRDCGILLVEHDMSVVMSTCDRLHVLDSGRTVTEGTPKDVYADPRVIEIYFGKRHGNHA